MYWHVVKNCFSIFLEDWAKARSPQSRNRKPGRQLVYGGWFFRRMEAISCGQSNLYCQGLSTVCVTVGYRGRGVTRRPAGHKRVLIARALPSVRRRCLTTVYHHYTWVDLDMLWKHRIIGDCEEIGKKKWSIIKRKYPVGWWCWLKNF